MTGLELIAMLLGAGEFAHSLASGLKQKKEAEKKKVSELFEHIGNLLHNTYVELNNGNYPHGHCAQIEDFGKVIIGEKFTKILGEADAKRLGNALIEAHQVERLFDELTSEAVKKGNLKDLEISSGKFLAASQLIKF